jgi:hypothetical protein
LNGVGSCEQLSGGENLSATRSRISYRVLRIQKTKQIASSVQGMQVGQVERGIAALVNEGDDGEYGQ